MHMRGHPTARALTLLCGMAAAAVAAQQLPQEPVPTLPPVEVLGVSPVPGVTVPKERIPANTQSARAVDIERSQAIDLTQFMNRRLGSVTVNEMQNNPFQPDVNFRGFTASPLLGTQQGLSVYLDGVRMNQPFGDVVSWDLMPKSAIAAIALIPGSNPLFGLNTLGGALAIQTKDGIRFPGTSVQVLGGSHSRAAVEFETGGAPRQRPALVCSRQSLPRRRLAPRLAVRPAPAVRQGRPAARSDGDVSLTLALADNDLTGNGTQEPARSSATGPASTPCPTRRRTARCCSTCATRRRLNDSASLSGNAYYREIKTSTYNGDINDDSLDQAVYQPNAAEQAALTAAGYTGFPTSGENASNTPFPKWRCIANALLLDEPAEKCNGVINQTHTDQSQSGLAAQLNFDGKLLGLNSQSFAGAALDASRSRFMQGSELGYLNPDRSITGVGAIGDGLNGGTVDGVPYDTRVDLSGRTQTWSLFGSSIVEVAAGTHVTLSGRYNHQTIRNRDAITPGGGPGSLEGDHVYSRFNPAIGLTFTPSAGLNVYVGVNQGSRAPSAIELGCADPANPCKLPNAFAGDPPLKQVVTTTFEAGVRGGTPAGVVWNVGVFRSVNKDDLLFVSDNASGFGFFKNFGKTRRQGIELGAGLQLAKGLTVGANLIPTSTRPTKAPRRSTDRPTAATMRRPPAFPALTARSRSSPAIASRCCRAR